MKMNMKHKMQRVVASALAAGLFVGPANADSDGAISALTGIDINDSAFNESTGVEFGGWLDFGATYNADNPDDNFNTPITFNDRHGEFQLNQFYLFVERAVDSSGNSWDLGGRVDLLFGTDARFTLNQNFDDELLDDEFSQFYKLSFPQAYAEIYAPVLNGVSAKIGHFYTIIGNEVVTAPDNFFYSHAYTMQYGEPFEHTGVLFTTPLSNSFTLMAGAVNGWDGFFGENGDIWNFLGGVSWSNDRTSVTVSAIEGAVNGDPPRANDSRWLYSIVATHDFTDRLHYTFQHDHAREEVTVPGPGRSGEVEWYGVNQYLAYDINDQVTTGIRAEWFRDDDGARVTGAAGSFYAVTLGVNWSPRPWIKFRPEVRYDWFDGNADVFDAGTEDNQLLVATDVVITF